MFTSVNPSKGAHIEDGDESDSPQTHGSGGGPTLSRRLRPECHRKSRFTADTGAHQEIHFVRNIVITLELRPKTL